MDLLFAVQYKNIKNNWPKWKCNPMVMPFASLWARQFKTLPSVFRRARRLYEISLTAYQYGFEYNWRYGNSVYSWDSKLV